MTLMLLSQLATGLAHLAIAQLASTFSGLSAATSVQSLLEPHGASLPHFHGLLGLSPDSIWNWKYLQKPIWTGIVFALRTIFCVAAAGFLVYEVRARRMGQPIPPRKAKLFAVLLAVLSFGVYFDYTNPHARYSEYYHRHEFYHYYLGAKYFDEIGYTLLYDCTMVAEVENGRGSQVAHREFRDLRVNRIKPVEQTFVLRDPKQCTQHFKPERWTAFKKDVDWFYQSARGSYWERMQQDHGYNPPPVWTMEGKLFASLHPADDTFFKWMAAIDVVLQAGMIALLFWAFGYRVGMVGAVFWGCNAAANFYWTGGAFLRQDWMFFLVASLALSRKRQHFWSGFCLMWSGLLRVFPALLFFGWGSMTLIYLVQRLRGRPSVDGKTGLLSYLHPDHRRVIAGAIVALSVLVPLSLQYAGGVQAYKEFAHHIGVHKATPLTNHMGLPSLLSHTWKNRMRFTRDESLDDAFTVWKDSRNQLKAERAWLQYSVFGVFCLWISWALHRSRTMWLAPALSLPLIFCATDLTCYYYSVFIIAAVVTAVRKNAGVLLLATGAYSVLLLARDIGYADVGLSGYYFIDDGFVVQSYLFLIFCILLLWSVSRPFSLQALRAFWERKPPVLRPTHAPDENPPNVCGA